MKARDIMTTNVVTITADTPVNEIAKLLLERHISGVPVLKEDGTVIGIVSEGDLIRRRELDTEHHRSWWLDWFSSSSDRARDYSREHGRYARDIMTAEVVSVDAEASLSTIADMLERKRIKRVPVVENGKLVGIVSRANLVQALSLNLSPAETSAVADDREIRRKLAEELSKEHWADSRHLNFLVSNQTVHFFGTVPSEEVRQGLRVAAESIPGVKAVNDDLEVRAQGLRSEQAHPWP